MTDLPPLKDQPFFLSPNERAKRMAKWNTFYKNVEEALSRPGGLRLSSMKVSYCQSSSFEDDESGSEVEIEKTKTQKNKKRKVSSLKYKEKSPNSNKPQKSVVSGNVSKAKRLKNNSSEEEQEHDTVQFKRGKKPKKSIKNKENAAINPHEQHEQINKSKTSNNHSKQSSQGSDKYDKASAKKRGRPTLTNTINKQDFEQNTEIFDQISKATESNELDKENQVEPKNQERLKEVYKISPELNQTLRGRELIVVLENLSRSNQQTCNEKGDVTKLAAKEGKEIYENNLDKDGNKLHVPEKVQAIPETCGKSKKTNKTNPQINQALLNSQHIANEESLSKSNKNIPNQEFQINEPDVTKSYTKEKKKTSKNNFLFESEVDNMPSGRQANINIVSNVCLKENSNQVRSYECYGFSPTNSEKPETSKTKFDCPTKNTNLATPIKSKIKEMKEALCQTDNLEDSLPKFKDSFSQTDENPSLSKSQMLDNLLELAIKRNESKVLQDGHKIEWSARFVKSLFLYPIDGKEIKAYIKEKMAMDQIEPIKQEIEVNLKSFLGNLLLLRKHGREDLNELISAEWKRLLKFMPLKSLVLYSRYILNQAQQVQV